MHEVKINLNQLQANHSKTLGLNIDENLSWKEHMPRNFEKGRFYVSVHLSESYLLFLCPLLLKYPKVFLNNVLITAVLFGKACLDSWMRKLKNYRICALPELFGTKSSYDTNSSSTRLAGITLISVRRATQKANLMYKYVNKLASVYVCNMFTPRTLSFDLRDTRKKLYLPKPRNDYLRNSFNSPYRI